MNVWRLVLWKIQTWMNEHVFLYIILLSAITVTLILLGWNPFVVIPAFGLFWLACWVGDKVYYAIKGKVIKYDIILTQNEAQFGVIKRFVYKNKKLDLKIPPGVHSRQKIIYRNALRLTHGYKGNLVLSVALDKDVVDLGYNFSSKIKLINNPKATSPTMNDLISFCLNYDHKGKKYVPNEYVCANFAERLHNVAESKGIRTAYVVVEFDSGELHAINLVETQTGQKKFIDTTAGNMTFVDVTLGNPYIPQHISLLNETYFVPLGTVKAIRKIVW